MLMSSDLAAHVVHFTAAAYIFGCADPLTALIDLVIMSWNGEGFFTLKRHTDKGDTPWR